MQAVSALEALYDRHHLLALGLAFRVLGDRESAEEVVQEMFLSVWRQASTFRPERGRAREWLLSIARHRASGRARRGDGGSTRPRGLGASGRQERRERVVSALAGLPPEQREAVELAYYGGLTHQEFAARIGMPLGTVKGRMRLAMEKLRLGLAELAPERGGG